MELLRGQCLIGGVGHRDSDLISQTYLQPLSLLVPLSVTSMAPCPGTTTLCLSHCDRQKPPGTINLF